MQTNRTQNSILHYIILAELSSHYKKICRWNASPMIFSRIWKGSYIGSYLLLEPGAECGWLQCAGLLRLLRILRILSTDVWCGVLPRASHRPPQHLPHPRISGRKLELSNKPLQRFHNLEHKHKHDLCDCVPISRLFGLFTMFGSVS